ncbi:hypothetical protein B566_EDAN018157 [Ephemera danica]|nr:hypothetical protein B566_EDAN018157 [Ephemera danica]
MFWFAGYAPKPGRSYSTNTDRPFACSYCHKNYGRKKHLVEHVKNIHGELSGPRICPGCSRQYKNAASLQMHLKSCIALNALGFTGPSRINNPLSREYLEPRFPCNQCGKVYLSRSNLGTHVKNIHGELSKPITCSECAAVCKNYRSRMVRARKIRKTGESKFRCPECHKNYTTKAHLIDHVRFIHGDLSASVTCPHCSKTFKNRRAEFDATVEATSTIRTKGFICNFCPKAYFHRTHLTTHIKNIHGVLSTPRTCPACNSIFKNDHSLRIHMKYRCRFQKYTIYLNFALQINSPGGWFTGKIRRRRATRFSPGKKFFCQYCKKVFCRKDNLRTHVKNIHGELAVPRTCSKCLKVYKNANSFNVHLYRCSIRPSDSQGENEPATPQICHGISNATYVSSLMPTVTIYRDTDKTFMETKPNP